MVTPSTSGYTQSIRQNLVDKGVSNADIGYNPQTGYVTVKGQDAIKSGKNYQGTNYTTQFGFNTDWDKYQKSLQPTTAQPTAATTGTQQPQSYTPYNPYQTSNPYDTQLNETIQMLMNQVNNPQAVDVNAIYNSPQYAAYQAQAQKGAQQGIRSAQEAMGAAGFGRSTALGERAQSIQNDANEYLNTQVLPQLMAAEQQQRQQALNNQLSMLGQLTQQQGVYDNRFNTANNYALQKGELLGNFRDPRADELIGMILNEKQNYANSQDATGRQTANQNATNYRNQLAAMGYDPALFGADQTLSQAQSNMSKAGQKTLSAQNMEYNQAADKRDFDYMKTQQEWDNLFKQNQFDEDKAARIWEQAFKEKSFNQSVKDAAASRGLQWASLNQREKERIADQTWKEKMFEYQKEQDILDRSSPGKPVAYDQMPEWVQEISSLNKDPEGTYDDLLQNSGDYIQRYSYDGYLKLLQQAKSLID